MGKDCAAICAVADVSSVGGVGVVSVVWVVELPAAAGAASPLINHGLPETKPCMDILTNYEDVGLAVAIWNFARSEST
jgi:hypothetical protein